MAESKIMFESQSGAWCVYSCACGCDGSVRIEDTQFFQLPASSRTTPRFYIRNHQPLGCDRWRTGLAYNYEHAPEDEFDVKVPTDVIPRAVEPRPASGRYTLVDLRTSGAIEPARDDRDDLGGVGFDFDDGLLP